MTPHVSTASLILTPAAPEVPRHTVRFGIAAKLGGCSPTGAVRPIPRVSS
ncbi:hypothetical protein [Paludibacterium paludis]|nr:hypothetical protein [Paludibacterium paludis]